MLNMKKKAILYLGSSFLVLACIFTSSTTLGTVSEVGVPLPWDRRDSLAYPFMGSRLVGAVDVALDTLNKYVLPDDFSLGVIYKDTRCDNIRGSGASVDLWQDNVTALIGPPCSSPCKTVAYFAAYAQIPMVSWFCAECKFTETENLPFFSRVFPPFTRISKFSVTVMQYFNWTVAALIAPQDTMWETLAIEISDSFEDAYLEEVLEPEFMYEGPLDYTLAETILRRAKDISRIIWLIVGGRSTLEDDELIFMKAAYNLGMTNGEYVFLRIELFPDPGFDEPWSQVNNSHITQDQMMQAFDSMLLLTHRLPWDEIDPFLKDVAAATLKADLPFLRGHNNLSFTEPSIMSAFLHDAVLLYGLAYNTSLPSLNNSEPTNISYEQFQDLENTFVGMTGPVLLDPAGDRVSDFSLYESTGKRAFYEIGILSEVNITLQLYNNVSISWPGQQTPSDAPRCGFHNELCLDIRITIAIVISGIVLLAIICSVLFASVRYRRFMSRTDWLIEWDSFTFLNNQESALGVQNYPSTYRLPNLSANFSRHSLIATSIDDVQPKATDPLPKFAVATLNSQTVVLRRGKIENLILNKETKRELKEMRWMVQDNINRFLGICVLPAPDNCFYHTSEFCSKGTLKSILAKDDINLDLSFKMSFIQDLARGMQYLHNSEIKSHGLLCSTLCFIDSRWVLKISGFGSLSFQMFKENVVTKVDPEARFSKMVWTSPELLRQELPLKGSVKGDVYSFGIMIHEIMTRTVPYSNFQTSSKETIRRVMKREEPPFRPDTGQEEHLEKDSMLAEIINLKRLCWEELPEHRPDFNVVRHRLRSMQKGHKNLNIMDNMLSKMEKYTENLEKVVANRTEQLLEEKKKTDALLYRMLPQVVADELKKGSTFPGEFFDEVTIYFSDIVRFTDLSAESSPMQVVDLLNDLYTCFDAIIEKFDVYKVETIGDAYMVVSGLPNRNGQKHASEIASMSLDIRNAVKGFRVRHRPDHQLQIRIGINSGPVCAGVVGLTMPRFCLFGDTVNTASRMESNSLPQKIHVSYPAAKLLTQLGGYCLEHRGELAVKGKGIMHTFWLIGRQDTCTSHETHNMMAGKKISTETLASIDSLLSPSGNGGIPNHQMEQRPTSKNSAESDGKSDLVNLPNVGESTTDSEEQNKSKCDIHNSSTIRISEGDQSKDNVEENVRNNVKQTDSNSKDHDNCNINEDNTVQDLTNGKPVYGDQHPSKEGETVFSKVSFRDVSPKKKEKNISDERSAKTNLQNNERNTNRNVSRNNKLHKLLGEKEFQSFEETVSPKQGLKKQAEVKSNIRTKSTKLETKQEINKNGSYHSVQSLEKISSFDTRSFNGSTTFVHDSPTKQNKSKESMSTNGEVPMSTPRINIDAVS